MTRQGLGDEGRIPDLLAAGVSKHYGVAGGAALDDISLSVDRGSFVAIIGPSGCGKTTLLRILSGLEAPTSGEVLLRGQRPEEFREQAALGVAFQDPALIPWRTVLENIVLPMEIRKRPKSEARERAAALIDLVGLEGYADFLPEQLSGGMRQRVSIARSLILDPGILLLDEPFGALDQILRRSLNVALQQIWMAKGPTALLVTHSIEEAVFLADRVLAMQGPPGRVVASLESRFPRPRKKSLFADPEFHALCDRLADFLEREEG